MNATQNGQGLKRIPSPPLNWNNIQKTKADAKREQQKQHYKNESLAREIDEREAQNRSIMFKQFLKNNDLKDSLPLEGIKTSLHKGGIQDKMRKAKKDLLDKVRKTVAIQLQNEAENEYAIDREHLSDEDNLLHGDEDEVEIEIDESTFQNDFDDNLDVGDEESGNENASDMDNEPSLRKAEVEDENSDSSDNEEDEASNSSCSDTNNDNISVSSKEKKRQKVMKTNIAKNLLSPKPTAPKLSKKIKSKSSRIEINALREKYFGSNQAINGASSKNNNDTNLTLLVQALDNTKTKKLKLPPQLKSRPPLSRHPGQ